MPDIAIKVENLGKRYKIGQRRSHDTLRDALAHAFKTPFGRLRKNPRPPVSDSPSSVPRPRSSDNTFWALKDVD